ncbi:MAG: hypothetical protein WBC44_13070 [Planctomycetaceae bacterium]
MNAKAKAGDRMVYRKTKFGTSPGPRATAVAPARHGEGYSYIVDKFWIVTDVLDDNRLRMRTRRGKEHVVRADDPNLRPARWWERWLYRERFREAEVAATPTRENEIGDDGIPAR